MSPSPEFPSPASPASHASPAPGSQTLARGLQALELLAEAHRPLSIAELAESLGVHRSNAYRLLRTLEEHRFAVRDDAGLIRLGPRVAALARGVAPDLMSAATPELSRLAQNTGMTAFLTVLDGEDIVTLSAAEPIDASAVVARRPGDRHPWHRGAPGHAIESALSPAERVAHFGAAPPSAASRQAATLGYALSESEVIAGVTSIAVPLRIPGEAPAAIAVVHFSMPSDLTEVVTQLLTAAERIARNYR